MEFDFWDEIEDKTKAAIMKAALKEFAEHGYENATTRSIAKTAGVANGLVFYHFKDKKTLYFELVAHIQNFCIEKLYTDVSTGEDFYGWLRNTISNKLRFTAEHPDVYMVFAEYVKAFPEAHEQLLKNINLSTRTVILPPANLEQEICYSALEGVSRRFAELYKQGKISSEQYLNEGIQKAEEYINYFERGTNP